MTIFGKGSMERKVPIGSQAKKALDEQWECFQPAEDSGPFFA
jgi:site-specific recombinase XerC